MGDDCSCHENLFPYKYYLYHSSWVIHLTNKINFICKRKCVHRSLDKPLFYSVYVLILAEDILRVRMIAATTANSDIHNLLVKLEVVDSGISFHLF